jgi:hypothetical protein
MIETLFQGFSPNYQISYSHLKRGIAWAKAPIKGRHFIIRWLKPTAIEKSILRGRGVRHEACGMREIELKKV